MSKVTSTKQNWEELINKTYSSNIPTPVKVVKLYVIAMLNYKQPVGEEALNKMRALIGAEAMETLFFLVGFEMAHSDGRSEHYLKILNLGS